MTINEELELSYYKVISELNADHGVFLVQDIRTSRLYVKKELTVYSTDVYLYLKSNPVINTPLIYEAVEDGNRLIVIEEFINGSSLQSLIDAGHIPEAEAIDIAMQLCRIVSDLHNCRPPIIHRDIKPSNIILTDDGTVKLLDMNAAKQYLGNTGKDTHLIGTVGYAAPEQYGFGSSSVQTDIYATGVLMATMEYGYFDRMSLTDFPYDRIIEKCTRIDPAGRYGSVGELIKELSQIDIHRSDRNGKRYIPWLLPGFRSLHPGKMILALILYALLFAAGTSIVVENPISELDVILNRVFFILCSLSATLFIGNYLNIWSYFGIDRIKNKRLRVLAAVAGGAIAFFAVLLILIIIESFLR